LIHFDDIEYLVIILSTIMLIEIMNDKWLIHVLSI